VQFYTQNGRFAFLSPLWGLGATHAVHLRLIAKLVADLVITELFSLGVAAEALRATIDWKSAFSLQQGPFGPKFPLEGVAPTNNFFIRKLG